MNTTVMKHPARWAIWGATGLIAVVALSFIVLLNFDWNRAKPWLSTRISAATGRTLDIGGNLALSWERPPEGETGWRRWVPWPHLRAEDVRLGNAAGFKAPQMAQAGRVDFVLSPLQLLDKKISVSRLHLDGARVNLERLADGSNNWTPPASEPSAWTFQLNSLVLNRGQVHLLDAVRHADLVADVDTVDDRDYGIAWKVRGTYNKEAASGSGRAGGLLALKASNAVYPIDADLKVGKTTLAVNGTLTRPQDLAALDMRLKMAGVSMAQLYPIIGVVLPETPPFATEGHLTAKLDKSGGDYVYDKFRGTVGGSDLSGTMEFETRKPRPLLKGTVVSNLLQFSDLAPLIGGDSNASKANRGSAPVQPTDKVLPVEAFKSERWTAIDADVKFTGRRIVRDQALPIDNLTTDMHLKDGVLSMAPLDFGVAGGTLRSTVRLDARGKLIKAEMKIAARKLQLHDLFPTSKSMQASLGEINGDASLSATGNSVAAMLGSSNGEIKGTIHDATISQLLLEEAGLNLGNIALTKITGDKQIRLNCMVSDFGVSNGQMQTRTLVIDTDRSVILADGSIDMTREQLDLTLKPRSKGVRLISLTAPLHVTGPFKDPKVSVDKGVVALKGGGAVLLALAAPVAALLPLTNLGRGKDSDCAKLLAQVRAQPVAPPPGQTAPPVTQPANTAVALAEPEK